MKKRSGKTVNARGRHRVQSQVSHEPHLSGIFLVGFMGAGKTSVGLALARYLNWAFEDLDERIERLERRSVPEIFRDSGESEFRRAEHAAVRSVLAELEGGAVRVVALGGGAFVQENNAALLKAAGVPTVFLDAPVEELWQRCSKQAVEAGTERPLLGSINQFRDLFEVRRNHYLQASLKIPTEGRSFEEIAAEIAEKLGLKRIEIRTQQGEVE
ncbi:MAG TPA: shikimate kinase [Candidatus Udaeobacter sp.]|nr:shikimate kinase [Candidatus Udaeobacter sp.]